MQVKRFRASKVHGYLNFDVRFRDDLTFLTGINGSGKTSVIQSIIALITPSFLVLANLEFQSIEVEVIHDGKNIKLRAEKTDGATLLSSSQIGEGITIRPFVPDPDEPPYRSSEKEPDYYRELATVMAAHPLMVHINSLPTPMFLDLDRRSRAIQDFRNPSAVVRSRLSRRGRNIFAFFLSQSLSLATDLAETSYRDNLIALSRIGEQLRRAFVLDLLELDTSASVHWALALPTKAELDTIQSFRQSMDGLPGILQIPKAEVQQRLVPSLNALEKYASAFPAGTRLDQIMEHRDKDDEKFRALIGWSAARPQLKKLVTMIERVKDYTNRKEMVTEKINRYLRILNDFFKDSDKEVSFSEDGYLQFTLRSNEAPRSMHSLSSGEAQLFVIVTHLFFNPFAQEGNVFIIDEPELSLHIQWQELFVSSVMAANPNVQYIMATHSPSIILSKIQNCIDLSAAKRASKLQ
jgi:predicted ATP-binding protein involved in virulence